MNEVELMELAAGVFGISSAELNLTTTPGDLPQWDSLKHLFLITAFEAKANVRLSMREIQAIAALGDFLTLHDSAS